MADRSDDIKQLFSHLGLNPGDYQELRDRNAATRSETRLPPAAPTAPVVAPSAAPTRQVRTVHIAPPSATPVAAAAPTTVAAPAPTVPAAAAVAASPSPVAAPTATPASTPVDAGNRWSLLRAAVETPTRVAQIDRAPAMPESAPTRRLFDDLSRRPASDATLPPVGAARRRWSDAAPTPTPTPTQIPAPPAPAVTVAPHAPLTPAAEPMSPLAEGELLDTFRRLVAPPTVVPPKPARLQFKYSGESAAARPRQPREENLDDVFSRIADPRAPR